MTIIENIANCRRLRKKIVSRASLLWFKFSLMFVNVFNSQDILSIQQVQILNAINIIHNLIQHKASNDRKLKLHFNFSRSYQGAVGLLRNKKSQGFTDVCGKNRENTQIAHCRLLLYITNKGPFPMGTVRCFNVDTTSISRRDVVDLESYVDATVSYRRRNATLNRR